MLLLDSEAISAVAHGPTLRRDRVRALVTEMRRRDLPVGTVAAVLAEVVRGRPRDAGVFAGLRRERVEVYPVDTRVGVRAGQLLGSAGAGSEHAVDAFIIAVADLAEGAVVATVDPTDLELFASYAYNVVVTDIRTAAG
jgi:predicted nucleic acid-binding protein